MLYIELENSTMASKTDYNGIAKVFWSGRSQAVRLPAACRFDTSEVVITKRGDQLILKPRGKNWTEYFGRKSRSSVLQRADLPAQDREAIK